MKNLILALSLIVKQIQSVQNCQSEISGILSNSCLGPHCQYSYNLDKYGHPRDQTDAYKIFFRCADCIPEEELAYDLIDLVQYNDRVYIDSYCTDKSVQLICSPSDSACNSDDMKIWRDYTQDTQYKNKFYFNAMVAPLFPYLGQFKIQIANPADYTYIWQYTVVIQPVNFKCNQLAIRAFDKQVGWENVLNIQQTSMEQKVPLYLDYLRDPTGCYIQKIEININSSPSSGNVRRLQSTLKISTMVQIEVCSFAFPISKRIGCDDPFNYIKILPGQALGQTNYKVVAYYLDHTDLNVKLQEFDLTVNIQDQCASMNLYKFEAFTNTSFTISQNYSSTIQSDNSVVLSFPAATNLQNISCDPMTFQIWDINRNIDAQANTDPWPSILFFDQAEVKISFPLDRFYEQEVFSFKIIATHKDQGDYNIESQDITVTRNQVCFIYDNGNCSNGLNNNYAECSILCSAASTSCTMCGSGKCCKYGTKDGGCDTQDGSIFYQQNAVCQCTVTGGIINILKDYSVSLTEFQFSLNKLLNPSQILSGEVTVDASFNKILPNFNDQRCGDFYELKMGFYQSDGSDLSYDYTDTNRNRLELEGNTFKVKFIQNYPDAVYYIKLFVLSARVSSLSPGYQQKVADTPLLKIQIYSQCQDLKQVSPFIFLNFTVDEIKPGTQSLIKDGKDFWTAFNYVPPNICQIEDDGSWSPPNISEERDYQDEKGVSWITRRYDSTWFKFKTDSYLNEGSYFEVLTSGNEQGYQKNYTVGLVNSGLDKTQSVVQSTVVTTICGPINAVQFNHSMCAQYYKTFIPDPIPLKRIQDEVPVPIVIPVEVKEDEVPVPIVIPVEVKEVVKQKFIEEIKINFPPSFVSEPLVLIELTDTREQYLYQLSQNDTKNDILQRILLPLFTDFEKDKVDIKQNTKYQKIIKIEKVKNIINQYSLIIDHSYYYNNYSERSLISTTLMLSDGYCQRCRDYKMTFIFKKISLEDREKALRNDIDGTEVLNKNETIKTLNETSNSTAVDGNGTQALEFQNYTRLIGTNETYLKVEDSSNEVSEPAPVEQQEEIIKQQPPLTKEEIENPQNVKTIERVQNLKKLAPQQPSQLIVGKNRKKSSFAGVIVTQQYKEKQPKPVEIILDEKPEDVFVRENPSLRKMAINKNGKLSINFSKKMKYPTSWESMMKSDQDKTTDRRQLQAASDFPKLVVEDPYGNQIFEIQRQDYKIESLLGYKIDIKIKWKNPSQISMGSQNEFDSLKIKWPQGLILTDEEGNGLILDGAQEDSASKTINNELTLQQQVDPESQETQTLESTATSMQASSNLLSVAQFMVTYILNTSLANFWGLLNSQQNLAYLPSLSINNPGEVSLYLEQLINIATFDPIPTNEIYEYFDIFDFQWTNKEPTCKAFLNIGYEDRVFITALGSGYIFIIIFAMIISYQEFFECCKFSRILMKILKYIKIKGYYRNMMIRFMIEGYIDLFISALINTENAYLFKVDGNFGLNGNLTKSDQLSVILGFFFFYTSIIFPIFVQWISIKKTKQLSMNKAEEKDFDLKYDCLYEDFKTFNQGSFIYYTLFIARRVLFVWLCFFMHEPKYSIFQIFFNLYLNLGFVGYLIVFRPFIDSLQNSLEVLNELAFVIIIYHQIGFTDLNIHASSKVSLGYSLICISIINLLFPNFYLVARGIWPDLKLTIQEKLSIFRPKKKENHRHADVFDRKRKDLIENYNLVLKEEFKNHDDDTDDETSDKEEVVLDLETYNNESFGKSVSQIQHADDDDLENDIFHFKQMKKLGKMKINHLVQLQEFDMQPQLSVIQEDINEISESSIKIQNQNKEEIAIIPKRQALTSIQQSEEEQEIRSEDRLSSGRYIIKASTTSLPTLEEPTDSMDNQQFNIPLFKRLNLNNNNLGQPISSSDSWTSGRKTKSIKLRYNSDISQDEYTEEEYNGEVDLDIIREILKRKKQKMENKMNRKLKKIRKSYERRNTQQYKS